MTKFFGLIAAIAAFGILLAEPTFAGGAPDGANGKFKTGSHYCKSGKLVQNEKACKENGGKL
jgi:hypothetical protein